MLKIYLIGIGIVAVTVILHAIGTTAWIGHLARRYPEGKGLGERHKALAAILTTVIVAIALHALQIAIWAVAYLRLTPVGELRTFEEAVYFSFVTFSTLGYGDITLSEGWRLLSGIEALNGVLLVGWTTALLFVVVQRTMKAQFAHKSSKKSKNKSE